MIPNKLFVLLWKALGMAYFISGSIHNDESDTLMGVLLFILATLYALDGKLDKLDALDKGPK